MCRNNGKVNIALFTAAVLLCLTLLTTHLTSGLYARYTTEASSSDSARVAKFVVTAAPANSDTSSITLTDKSPEAAYTFSVSGETETTWKYDIIVKQANGERLPNGISLTLEQEGVSIALPLKFEETQQLGTGFAYRVKSVQTVQPGSHHADYTISFTADYKTLTDGIVMKDITISVLATQVD